MFDSDEAQGIWLSVHQEELEYMATLLMTAENDKCISNCTRKRYSLTIATIDQNAMPVKDTTF